VATRNEARAMTIAENFASNPKDHPLLVSVMSLFGQFKQIFVYNYCVWQARHKGVAMPSDMELMAMLRLPGVFVVNELKAQASLWPNKITFRVLGLLREYDAKSKGMNDGGMSDGELLRELLLKMFMMR
jgi:DNA polymerase-3 subunit delta